MPPNDDEAATLDHTSLAVNLILSARLVRVNPVNLQRDLAAPPRCATV